MVFVAVQARLRRNFANAMEGRLKGVLEAAKQALEGGLKGAEAQLRGEILETLEWQVIPTQGILHQHRHASQLSERRKEGMQVCYIYVVSVPNIESPYDLDHHLHLVALYTYH